MRVDADSATALAPSETEPEQTCSTFMTGDRLCTTCGYNLIGQSILREPRYELLIARCPECGTVAAVQEYPLLGRWAHRWGFLFAALWIIFVISGWFGTGAMMMGMSIGASEEAARPYSNFIQDVFQEVEQQAQQNAAAATAPTTTPTTAPATSGIIPALPANMPPGTVVIRRSGRSQSITTIGGSGSFVDFGTWWKKQDQASLLAQAGGWRLGLRSAVLIIWFFCALSAFVVGCFWATVLVQLRRRGLLIWAIAAAIAALALSAIPIAECLTNEPHWSWSAGRYQLVPLYIGFSLVIYITALVAGLMVGRTIARQLVRALLPPRLRHALAILWTTDGKQLPNAR